MFYIRNTNIYLSLLLFIVFVIIINVYNYNYIENDSYSNYNNYYIESYNNYYNIIYDTFYSSNISTYLIYHPDYNISLSKQFHNIVTASIYQSLKPTIYYTIFKNPVLFNYDLVLYKDTHEIIISFNTSYIIGILKSLSLKLNVYYIENIKKIPNFKQSITIRLYRGICKSDLSYNERKYSIIIGTYDVSQYDNLNINIDTSLVGKLNKYYDHGLGYEKINDLCFIVSTDDYNFIKLDRLTELILEYNRFNILNPPLLSLKDIDKPIYPIERDVYCPSLHFNKDIFDLDIYYLPIDNKKSNCYLKSSTKYALLSPIMSVAYVKILSFSNYLMKSLTINFYPKLSENITIKMFFKVKNHISLVKAIDYNNLIDLASEFNEFVTNIDLNSDKLINCNPYSVSFIIVLSSLNLTEVKEPYINAEFNSKVLSTKIFNPHNNKASFNPPSLSSAKILPSKIRSIPTFEFRNYINRFYLSQSDWYIKQLNCPDSTKSEFLESNELLGIADFEKAHSIIFKNLTKTIQFSGCLPKSLSPIKAKVPGYIHLDLLRNNIIDDPLSEDNDARFGWISSSDWLYFTEYKVPQNLKLAASQFPLNYVQLKLLGIDTVFSLNINNITYYPIEKSLNWNGTHFKSNLNMSSIFSGDNMHVEWTYNLPQSLFSNEILLFEIIIHSPISYSSNLATSHYSELGYNIWHQKLNTNFHPDLNSTINSPLWAYNNNSNWNFIRKAAYHFGWDWGPSLISMGIWKDLYFEIVPLIKIADIVVHNKVDVGNSNTVYSNAELYFKINDNFANCDINWYVELELSAHFPNSVKYQKLNFPFCDLFNGSFISNISAQYSINTWKYNIEHSFKLLDYELWWPRGYGSQYLFNFTVSNKCLIYSNNNANPISSFTDSFSQNIGYRDLKVINGNGEFAIYINGKKIWVYGVNYIPAHIFYLPQDPHFNSMHSDTYSTTHSPKSLIYYFKSLINSNINLIRVWGGGVYESDLFYSLADKYGIMIWQDYMFSCALYPSTSTFLSLYAYEVGYQTRKLSKYTSLVVWCGSNEVEWNLKLREYGPLKDVTDYALLNQDFIKIFMVTIKRVMIGENPLHFNKYILSSPTNGNSNGEDILDFYKRGYPNNEWLGTIHSWEVWFDLTRTYSFYERIHALFISEFGFQSLPSLSSIKFEDWSSEATTWNNIKNRQRSPNGMNYIMDRLNANFNHDDSTSSLIYFSNILQTIILESAFVHFRTLSSCSGLIVWQLNDIWSAPSWSLIEYSGVWKPSMFMLQHLFSDVLVVAKIVYPLLNEIGSIDGVIANETYLHETKFLNSSELQVWIISNTVTTGKQPYSFTLGLVKISTSEYMSLNNWIIPVFSHQKKLLYSSDLNDLISTYHCSFTSCFIVLTNYETNSKSVLFLTPTLKNIDVPLVKPTVKGTFNYIIEENEIIVTLNILSNIYLPYSWFEFIDHSKHIFKFYNNLILLSPDYNSYINLSISNISNECVSQNECLKFITDLLSTMNITCLWGSIKYEILYSNDI